jgi:hypothetical protein
MLLLPGNLISSAFAALSRVIPLVADVLYTFSTLPEVTVWLGDVLDSMVADAWHRAGTINIARKKKHSLKLFFKE